MGDDHKVVTVRDNSYPFKPFWMCVCGTRLKAAFMGSPLYREFNQHKMEKMK